MCDDFDPKDDARATLTRLRRKHGFKPEDLPQGKHRAGGWSRRLLTCATTIRKGGQTAEAAWADFLGLATGEIWESLFELIPEHVWRALVAREEHPRNKPLYEYVRTRLADHDISFSWRVKLTPHSKRAGEMLKALVFSGQPSVGSQELTALDMAIVPVELLDQYRRKQELAGVSEGKTASGFPAQLKRMSATGIGYSGFADVSWLPGLRPFDLQAGLQARLQQFGNGVFMLTDVVAELLRAGDRELAELLGFKVPSVIPRFVEPGTLDMFRPDIVLLEDGRFVITEIETAPAGHGFLHAMERGYGYPEQMAEVFCEYLDGRDFVIFATHEWSEYVYDLAVWCKALRERGVNARVVFDRPLEVVAQTALKWGMPAQTPNHLKLLWRRDVLSVLRQKGLFEVVEGASEFPSSLDDTVVFRFGYFDNFGDSALEVMKEWQKNGATIMNPLHFFLESKVLMAALGIQSVRQQIRAKGGGQMLELLDDCIASTWLLREDTFYDTVEDRALRLVKAAGFTLQNQSWGARSLAVGTQFTDAQWEREIESRLELSYPTVAQHVIASNRFNVPYVDETNTVRVMEGGRVRWTPYLVRVAGQCRELGSLLTFRKGSLKIHGATDSVETLGVYGKDPAA